MWIRDALNGELASILPPPPLCIGERKRDKAFHVNNLSIIGLEGHRAGGKKRKWRIGREGCQDPAQLGQDVERVAPVNVPTTTSGKGHCVRCWGTSFQIFYVPCSQFSHSVSNFVRIVATSQRLSSILRCEFFDRSYLSCRDFFGW